MPSSPAARQSVDAPTRHDLYQFESVMESLARSIDDLTRGIADKGELETNIDDLKGAIDSLTNAIEKLPEELAPLFASRGDD